MATDTLTKPVIAGGTTTTKVFKNFIDGEWVESTSGQTFEDRNPADTREVVAIFQRSNKADVDANFIRLMQMLLSSGFYHGIATHDPRMIAATIRYAAAKQISKDDFEFQMLYGVRTDLQRRLVKDGYRVRIYIPYGKDWFPYFMRRLAERPANLGFLVRNFFRS